MVSKWFHRLLDDETGLVLSAELIIIVTITVLGLVVGLAAVQEALVGELTDISGAFRSLNQSYGFTGFRGCRKIWGRTSWTTGSSFRDYYEGCYGNQQGFAAEIGGGRAVGGASQAVTTPCPDGVPCNENVLPPVTGPQLAPCETCLPDGGVYGPVPEPRLEVPAGPVPQPSPQQL